APFSGELTVQINYHLSHAGVPLLVPGWEQQAIAQLSFNGQDATASLSSVTSPSDQTGTLSLTQMVQAGQTGLFSVGALLQASPSQTHGGSVPVPGMVWITGSGLVLLAVWRARRRI